MSYYKEPNRFTKSRPSYKNVEDTLTDEALRSNISAMIDTGTLPMGRRFEDEVSAGLQGRITGPRVVETAKYKIEFWCDLNDADNLPYQARITNKRTGEVETHHESDETNLRLSILAEVGNFQVEQREIAEESIRKNPLPEDFEDSREARAMISWLQTTVHGGDYESIACPNAWKLMEDSINEHDGGEVTVGSLERAYCRVADNPDYDLNFEKYFQRRDRLAREAAEEAIENQEAAEEQSLAESQREAEEEALSKRQAIQAEQNELAEAKRLAKEDLPELRRRAIFGERSRLRVPSTGTGRRI